MVTLTVKKRSSGDLNASADMCHLLLIGGGEKFELQCLQLTEIVADIVWKDLVFQVCVKIRIGLFWRE